MWCNPLANLCFVLKLHSCQCIPVYFFCLIQKTFLGMLHVKLLFVTSLDFVLNSPLNHSKLSSSPRYISFSYSYAIHQTYIIGVCMEDALYNPIELHLLQVTNSIGTNKNICALKICSFYSSRLELYSTKSGKAKLVASCFSITSLLYFRGVCCPHTSFYFIHTLLICGYRSTELKNIK